MTDLQKLKYNKKPSNFSIAQILADDTTKSPQLWSIHLIKMNSIQNKIIPENNINNNDVYVSTNNKCVEKINSSASNSLDIDNECHLIDHHFFYSSSANEFYQNDNGSKNDNDNNKLFSDKRKLLVPNKSEFPWLQCTRYHPPKIPKKLVNRNCKRKPALYPRIPFTQFQLEILEAKYKDNAYLTKKDALQLSTTLRLPQNRIKIWFQNRRARDRKETKAVNNNVVDT